MACFGFQNASEFVVFLTSLLVGVTMVMGVNAINSAPNFILKYYEFIASPNSQPKMPKFWANILNYYTIITIVVQSIHEPTNVTPFLCRFSLLFRLELSCLVMMVELLVILLMPFGGTSEEGAIAGMMIAAYLGGVARAYFENTGYALFGPCPSKMMSAMLIGSALSGAIVSVMQIVLKASMPDTHDSILQQSVLYFSLTLAIIFAAGALLFLLLLNPFAKQFVAELRSRRGFWQNIYRPLRQSDTANAPHENDSPHKVRDNEDACDSHNTATFPDSDEIKRDALSKVVSAPPVASKQLTPVDNANSAKHSTTGGTHAHPISLKEGTDISTSELLQGVKLWPVIKKTYPMMLSAFLTFGVTYLIYPGIFLAVDANDGWYTTLIMACYNFCDLIGRVVSMWKRVWPSRRFILIVTIVRIVFVPLQLLCALHIIPGKTASYVFTTLLGLTNGFFGTLAMVYAPFSPGLESDAEQALAGQVSGACLLLGCSVGSLLQLAEVIPFT
ncbi:unnamed protein product, partial [Phytomonas sp. EM1]